MKRIFAAAITSLLLLTGGASAQTTPGSSSEAGRFTVSPEALLWWLKDKSTPPLVTNGVLGAPGTKVFLGGRDEDTGANPGFRLGWSYALTEQWGLESNFFYVPTRTTSRNVSSSGQPGSENLSVSIVDATTGVESTAGLSSAGQYSGRAQEQLSNNLLGAELNGTMRLASGSAWRVDALGAPVTYAAGGYFATPTNFGERTRDVFAVVPEAGLTLGYRLTPAVSIVAGYTFIYASDVVRAPNQINRTVNYSSGVPAPPTGPQEPSFKFKSSDFWAQGLNAGVAFRF